MARTKRSANLEFWSQRQKLEAGRDHTETLAKGRYLLYHRPMNGAAGSWRARWYDPETRAMRRHPLGIADDFLAADGVKVLTYSQATAEAEKWFADQEHRAIRVAGGEVPHVGPYLVADAMKDYVADLRKRGARSADTVENSIQAHILPPLGKDEVGRLTKKRIEDWLLNLASSGKRRSVKRGAAPETYDAPSNPEQIRQRKDTANRILTNLKAGLNLAHGEGKTQGATPWRDVKPFKNVGKSRVRFLSVKEQQALVDAAGGTPEFQALLRGALACGARYGELGRCKVKDFSPVAKTLFIEVGKNGKPRHIRLAPEAVAWFKQFTKGRDSEGTLFPHTGISRRTRGADSDDWLPHDQKDRMLAACVAANVKPLGFHELRHTYASGLVNAGMSLKFVADQLGHSDTRMVERYYGHLASTALAKAVDSFTPTLGIFGKKKAPK